VWVENTGNDEYTSYQRGRVSYNKGNSRYEVKTGFKVIPKKLFENVKTVFQLPNTTIPLYDSSYG
jgi:hypothetical protein